MLPDNAPLEIFDFYKDGLSNVVGFTLGFFSYSAHHLAC
jgi:hypothetical protein